MKHIVNNWVKQLELTPHPEGGYYKEIIKGEWDETTSRASYSSIYFLLTHDNISHFHRIDVDEIWYYHAGDSLTVHMIHQTVLINMSLLVITLIKVMSYSMLYRKERYLLRQLKVDKVML